jgi:hypothetical protein
LVQKIGQVSDLGKKIDRLLADRGLSPEMPLPHPVLASTISLTPSDVPPHVPDIDGEVYRIAISPRTMAWELVRDIYRIQGRQDEASVDCDVLVEMYLVNTSRTETRYVRDLKLSAEVSGKRVFFQRQDDLRAKDFADKGFEYGVKDNKGDEAGPVKQLFSALPIALAPTQPVEGWVRFMAKDINPDEITEKSWQLSVVDSVGHEHAITKAVLRERKGEVALRRLRG